MLLLSNPIRLNNPSVGKILLTAVGLTVVGGIAYAWYRSSGDHHGNVIPYEPKVPSPTEPTPTLPPGPPVLEPPEDFASPYYRKITLSQISPDQWRVEVQNIPPKIDGLSPEQWIKTFDNRAKAVDFAERTAWAYGMPQGHGQSPTEDILVRVASSGTDRRGSVWQSNSEGWFYTIAHTPNSIYRQWDIPGIDQAIEALYRDLAKF